MKTLEIILFSLLIGFIVWQNSLTIKIIEPIQKPPENIRLAIVLEYLGCPKYKIDEIHKAIELASSQTNISPYLISVLMHTESNFSHKVISKKNYKGLMQTPWASMKYFDVDTLHGARILKDKLNISNGDVYKALYLYKGGNNKTAKKQAIQVVNLYEKIKVRFYIS